MSKPHQKSYSISMFIFEGNPIALRVTRAGSKYTERHVRMTPEAALAWCRRNHAGMVYSPASVPQGN